MKQAPYTHPADAQRVAFIAGKMFRPGETRMIDAALVPGAAVATTPVDTLAAEHNMQSLQADSIAAIKAQFANLSADQLDELLTLERAQAKPRRGLTEAVEEELLARETHPVDDTALETLREGTVEAIADTLETLTGAELDRLQSLESDDDDPRSTLLDAIGVERSNRQAPE